MTAGNPAYTFRRMDQERALRELPEIYAAALRLRDAGLDDDAIAARLGMPVEGLPPLLMIAAAKLAAVMDDSRIGGDAA
jgi:DNA-directed RNA polymerase specialized sigma24 family protein